MKHLALWLFVLTCSTGFQDPNKPKPQLWATGPMHPNEVVGKSGEMWFGLFESLYGFDLFAVQVQIQPAHPKRPNEVYVGIHYTVLPIFLVRGISGLSDGPMKTIFQGSQFLKPGQQLNLGHSDRFTVTFLAEGVQDAELIRDYSIVAFSNGRRQTITQSPLVHIEGVYPRIRWVGDLNRDEGPDFLIDLGKANGSRDALFLSSESETGDPFELVALFERTGR